MQAQAVPPNGQQDTIAARVLAPKYGNARRGDVVQVGANELANGKRAKALIALADEAEQEAASAQPPASKAASDLAVYRRNAEAAAAALETASLERQRAQYGKLFAEVAKAAVDAMRPEFAALRGEIEALRAQLAERRKG